MKNEKVENNNFRSTSRLSRCCSPSPSTSPSRRSRSAYRSVATFTKSQNVTHYVVHAVLKALNFKTPESRRGRLYTKLRKIHASDVYQITDRCHTTYRNPPLQDTTESFITLFFGIALHKLIVLFSIGGSRGDFVVTVARVFTRLEIRATQVFPPFPSDRYRSGWFVIWLHRYVIHFRATVHNFKLG